MTKEQYWDIVTSDGYLSGCTLYDAVAGEFNIGINEEDGSLDAKVDEFFDFEGTYEREYKAALGKLKGKAYAVFNSESSTLYFIRSTEKVANNTKGSITSVSGHKFSGTIFTNFELGRYEHENEEDYNDNYWYYDNTEDLLSKDITWRGETGDVKEIVFVDPILPHNTSMWFLYFNELETVIGIQRLHTNYTVNMYEMFGECTSLKSIDISHFNLKYACDIYYIFDDCRSLKEVTVAPGDIKLGSKAARMITNFSNLVKKGYVREAPVEKLVGQPQVKAPVEKLVPGSQFKSEAYAVFVYEDRALYFIRSTDKVGDYLREFGRSVNNMYYDTRTRTITSIDGKKYTGIIFSNIEDASNRYGRVDKTPWEEYAVDIVRVVICNTIRPLTTSGWFAGLYSAWSIEGLEHIDTRYVTDMTGMFYSAGIHGNIDISKFKTNNVKSMRMMFFGCRYLTGVNLTGLNTGNVVDMEGMFEQSAITKIDLSKLDLSNVKNAAMMFRDCDNLQAIKCNIEAIKAIPVKRQIVYRCDKLTKNDIYEA